MPQQVRATARVAAALDGREDAIGPDHPEVLPQLAPGRKDSNVVRERRPPAREQAGRPLPPGDGDSGPGAGARRERNATNGDPGIGLIRPRPPVIILAPYSLQVHTREEKRPYSD
jgi:hypothetical protein